MKKCLVFIFMIVFLGCLVVSVSAGEKSTWRVDGKLISEGDSQYKVRSIAGKPDWKDVRTIEEEFTHDEKVVTVWTYDKRNAIYKVFFRDSIVQKIAWERN